jgi:hypothetical protein
VSFAGIVDAQRCATEMQAAMTERTAGATSIAGRPRRKTRHPIVSRSFR